MILLLDVGNTNVAYAFYEKGKIIKGSFVNNSTPLDEFIKKIEIINKIDFNQINTFVVSSVVPKYTKIFKTYANEHHKKIIEIGKVKTGINIKTGNPKEIGADLITTAAGTNPAFNSLIFDFGTALTATYLEKNVFIGCNITLGVGQIVNKLDSATALLYQTNIEKENIKIGKTTPTAINIGVYQSINGFIKANIIIAKAKFHNLKIYFTGNDANIFYSEYSQYIFDNELIFKGLANIYEINN